MFEPTIPFGEPELMRASAYRLYLQELDEEAAKSGVSSRIASLSPSLRADLYRFEADGGTSEVLEVVAACVRHAKRVAIHLQSGEHVVPLTVFPEERLVHCPLAMDQLLAKPELYASEPKRAADAQVRYAQIDEELTAALERWEALGSR